MAAAWAAPCMAQRVGLLGNPDVAPLGLETAWSTFVRVDPARGRLATLQMTAGVLLAQTDRGTLQAIHPESGRTLWTADVGNATYETMPPSANEKFVAVTNGSTLYVFDRASGATLWQHRVSGSPCAGTAMSDTRVYVPLDNGLVEAYLLERAEGRELYDGIPKRYSGSGGAVAAPVIVGKRCNWGVAQGFVYSSEETFKDLVQFRFRVDDKLSVGPTVIGPMVYAASRRGTVFALDGTTGAEIWRFSLGTSVSHPLTTIDGEFYVVSELGDMVRLNPRFGRQHWYGRGVKAILAAGTDHLYHTDLAGRLTVRSVATGGVLGAVAAVGFDLPCYNMETDRIYLASSRGVVQALRPQGSQSPKVRPLKAGEPTIDYASRFRMQSPGADGRFVLPPPAMDGTYTSVETLQFAEPTMMQVAPVDGTLYVSRAGIDVTDGEGRAWQSREARVDGRRRFPLFPTDPNAAPADPAIDPAAPAPAAVDPSNPFGVR